MKIRLTAYSCRILLLLMVSTQFICTDTKNFKQNSYNKSLSFFDSRSSEAREFVNQEKLNDQDSQDDVEHKSYKKHRLLLRVLNNDSRDIQRNLKDEDVNTYELLKDVRSRIVLNNSRRENHFGVEAGISYVAMITTTASIVAQRMLEATTVLPSAIIDAYKNKRIERKRQNFLEPEFDYIGWRIDRKKYKADSLRDNNAVYSVAVIPVVAAIAEGVAVVAAAMINNTPVQPEIRPEQQSQEQPKNQISQQQETNVVPVEAPKKVAQKSSSVAIKNIAKKTVEDSVQSDKSQIIAQETLKKDVVLLPADVAVSAQKNAEHSQFAALRAHEDQRAYDRKVRDDVVDTAIFVGATLLQQYDQRQKLQRKQERLEACIQERMKSENKSRWQIEQEIRLCQEAYEQERQDRQQQEQKKRYNEEQKTNKQKRDQPGNNGSRKDNDPDNDPDHDPKKGALAGTAGTKKAKDELDKAHKKRTGSQGNSKNCKPTQEEIRRNQSREYEYTHGKGVHESNPKHHLNAIWQDSKRTRKAYRGFKRFAVC